jgi:hypothetical protein
LILLSTVVLMYRAVSDNRNSKFAGLRSGKPERGKPGKPGHTAALSV